MDINYNSEIFSSINTVSNNGNMRGKKKIRQKDPLSANTNAVSEQYNLDNGALGHSDVYFTFSPAVNEETPSELWQDGASNMWSSQHHTLTPHVSEQLYQLSAPVGQVELYQTEGQNASTDTWSENVGGAAAHHLGFDDGFPGSAFGSTRLPPDLEDTINSLLPDDNFDNFPFGDTLDVDINAANTPGFETLNLDDIDEIPLDEPFSNLTVTAQPIQAVQTSPQLSSRRRNRGTSRRTAAAEVSEQLEPQPLPSYPQLEEMGLDYGSVAASPVGSTCSSGEETGVKRKRRRRVDYSKLTEEEKYHRIRDLNNEASRHYRQRHKKSLTNLQLEEKELSERNKVLQEKALLLEQLRNQWRDFSNKFMQQHHGRR